MRLLLLFAIVSGIAMLHAEEPRLASIVFTNDAHGMAWAFDEIDNPGVGGLAAQKTIVDKIREEAQLNNGDVVLLSSGNITMGDPRSNICENIPLIKGMNLIAYDAMTVGNHEFDFGLPVFKKMQKEASFPFISANLADKNGKPLVKEYVEKQLMNGLKVAIIGITTPETQKITQVGLKGEIKVADPLEKAKKLAAQLKKSNDIVIILSSLGWYENDKSYDGFAGDRTVAKEAASVDLIIGGHTKTHLEKPDMINNIPIVQTEGYGKWVARFDIVMQNQKVIQTNYKLYPVNVKKKIVKGGKKTYENIGSTVKENSAMLDLLKGFSCEFSTETIGETEIEMSGKKDYVRAKEAEIANAITDIIKERTASQIVFINAGGIRQGLKKGLVTEKDIYSVFPFNDTIVTGEISGEELESVIMLGASKKGSGGFLQVSGISYEIKGGKAQNILINGEPLAKEKKYLFATNSFLAGGGDGYTMLQKLKDKRSTGLSVPAVVVEYIKMEKILPKPHTGRIKTPK